MKNIDYIFPKTKDFDTLFIADGFNGFIQLLKIAVG